MRILYVGLGQVSIGYDLLHQSRFIKSHLYAIHRYCKLHNVRAEIVGVDPDTARLRLVKNHFPEIKLYKTLSEIPNKTFDIVVNATPISTSLKVTLEILDMIQTKNLYVEKPGAANIQEVHLFNQLSEQFGGIKILYPRRYLPSSKYIKEKLLELPNSSWSISIKYSGNPVNILSHFLDILDFFFEDDTLTPHSYNVHLRSITQTASVNYNDHEIQMFGPFNLGYLKGGARAQIISNDGRVENFDFTSELIEQVKHSTFAYLDTEFLEISTLNFRDEISGLLLEAYK